MKVTCPSSHLPAGFAERQQALDSMVEVCRQQEICAPCTASAALYLAAMAATTGMNVGREEFLEMASSIFLDALSQVRGRRVH